MSVAAARTRLRKTEGLLLAAAVVAVTATATATATAVGDTDHRNSYSQKALQKDVNAVLDGSGGTSVLAAVTDPKKTVRARAGTVAVDGKEQVPWDARFRTASTTKAFTAVVVLQLVAEGKLSLDDTVDHWLPGMVTGNGNDGTRITVRSLLQQTSGIPDYLESATFQEKMATPEGLEAVRFDATTAPEYVAAALTVPAKFRPGQGWSYSNTNYILAGMIIEKASGVSWRDAVENRIVGKLGLRGTSTSGLNPFIPGPHARNYIPTEGGPLDMTDNSFTHDADDSVISTTEDLNRFFQALVRGELLPPAQLKEMQTTVAVPEPPLPGAQYGLGLIWVPLSCGDGYWTHPGDGPASSTRTGVTADGRRSVVVSIASAATDVAAMNRTAGTLVDKALCASP